MFSDGLFNHGLVFWRRGHRMGMMLMLGCLLLRRVIMPHKFHHEQVRNWAQHHHAKEYDLAQRDLEEVHGYQPRDRDEAAQNHHPDVRFFHE
jgi:hypothetical protein